MRHDQPRGMTTPVTAAVLAVVAVGGVAASRAMVQGGVVGPDGADAATPPGKTTIVIAASGAAAPITDALAAAYAAQHPDVVVDVRHATTAPVLAALAAGRCAIAASPAPATGAERKRVRFRQKTDAVASPIAMDAVVLFVNPAVNTIESLTLGQIGDIFAHKIAAWDELGVAIDEIHRIVPDAVTGSLHVLKDRALGGRGYTTAVKRLPNARAVVNDTAADIQAIGVGALGYATGVRVLRVARDDDTPGVAPSRDNVRSGRYPLAHYIYWYTSGPPTGAVQALIRFAQSRAGQRVIADTNAGPLPLPLGGGVE